METAKTNPPPQKQCPYCGDWFVPKAHTVQKMCGKSECFRKRQKEAFARSIKKNPERYKDYWKKAGVSRRKPQVEHYSTVPTPFLPCYNCGYYIRKTDYQCRYCETVVDVTKSEKFGKKENKTYLDTVKENALKSGKDPKAEVRRMKTMSQSTFMGPDGATDVNQKIAAWLKKRGHKHYFNNREIE